MRSCVRACVSVVNWRQSPYRACEHCRSGSESSPWHVLANGSGPGHRAVEMRDRLASMTLERCGSGLHSSSEKRAAFLSWPSPTYPRNHQLTSFSNHLPCAYTVDLQIRSAGSVHVCSIDIPTVACALEAAVSVASGRRCESAVKGRAPRHSWADAHQRQLGRAGMSFGPWSF